ncbi:MAG: (deoxy)nucleoside triphosphate pyrophosphohydrolase [Tangfeifania sp.]
MIDVVCAIIFDKNRILLTQRGEHPHHAFQWEFPGGKVKPDETEEQSIHREIREELEIEIGIAEKLIPVIHDYGFKKIRLIPFLCFPKNEKLILNEHVGYRWVRWQELDKMNLSGADSKLLSRPENQNLLEKYSR